MEHNITTQPERVRVSIFERIVPFAALALAAVGGAVGGWMILSLMRVLAIEENVGRSAMAAGLAEYIWYPLVFLYAACGLCVVAICVALGRLMIESKTSSPSGISYLVLGVMSLVPVALVWLAGSLIITNALNNPTTQGLAGDVGSSITIYSAAAAIAAPLILLVLLAWSLIPFRSQPGRRVGPIICLILVEIMLVTVTIAFQFRVFDLYKIHKAVA